MWHRRARILIAAVCILCVAGASFAANLSVHGGFVLFQRGSCWGATLEMRPVAGHFLVPEVSVAYAQGDAPVEPAPWPGGSHQEYDYSRWRDYFAAARLKLQGIVPNHPVYFALGVGIGPHLVGAKKKDNYWHDTSWHDQWQFQGLAFVQMNVRLDSQMSVFTEIEVTRSFERLQNPQIFPQGFAELKFGLRFHPATWR